ncbi:pyrroloquinoline quinone biosynthesis peptide chaperone PqqD [Streptomyces blastmyceticus]|uniref:pyrroloquinoline quinone biosynthesis peptide chaperone PqqD n=1 Tax=Streptomyces blastmyceticus TaxID=68180 RepID=UPI0031DAE675
MLRYDGVRERELLIVPERVVILNRQAGEVLRLCDGTRSVKEIIAVLAERYPHAPVAADVLDFLGRMRSERWLR